MPSSSCTSSTQGDLSQSEIWPCAITVIYAEQSKSRKQETFSLNRPNTWRQFSNHSTGRAMNLNFIILKVTLDCILEMTFGTTSLVTSIPSLSTCSWKRSKMCSLEVYFMVIHSVNQSRECTELKLQAALLDFLHINLILIPAS